MTRVKCPRERQAKSGHCQRQGCNHLCAEGSRICGCCLVQLGQSEFTRLRLMRQFAADYELARAEEVALDQLNALPPRVPIGRGWTTVSGADQRRREWRR